MDSTFDFIDAWLVSLIFAVAMLACWFLGWRRGRRRSVEPTDDPGSKFTDASVALLGLLLAFTFSIALGRYEMRRQAVVNESNAIGDFHTCATLLKEPHRSRLRTVIRKYAQDQRDTPRESLYTSELRQAVEHSNQSVDQMTEIVNQAIAEGTPTVVPLTNALNNLTSSTATRIAVFEERLPWSIVTLLFLSAIVPAFLVGEKQGAARIVHVSGSICFIGLVALVIFVTVDLNQPRRGLIRVSYGSLERVIQSMSP